MNCGESPRYPHHFKGGNLLRCALILKRIAAFCLDFNAHCCALHRFRCTLLRSALILRQIAAFRIDLGANCCVLHRPLLVITSHPIGLVYIMISLRSYDTGAWTPNSKKTWSSSSSWSSSWSSSSWSSSPALVRILRSDCFTCLQP